MYYEASSGSPGDTATMLSKEYTARQCMSFWYHMNGHSVGTLQVKNEATGQTLFTETGAKGDQWLNEKVDVFNSGSAYKVIFLYVDRSVYPLAAGPVILRIISVRG